MAKFYGAIGFGVSEETDRGVYDTDIEEHFYSGDIYRSSRRLQIGDQINGEVSFSKEVSILMDPFAYSNYASIQYVSYLGAKWTVTSVDVQYPRLVLTLGGQYNER